MWEIELSHTCVEKKGSIQREGERRDIIIGSLRITKDT